MGMTTLNQIGILPALLVTLGGLLMLRSAGEEMGRRRFVRYLLVMAGLMLAILFVSFQRTSQQDNRLLWQASTILTPTLIGVLALVVLHWKQITRLDRGAKLLALLLVIGLVTMLVSYRNAMSGLFYYMVPGVLVLVLGWTLGRRSPKPAVFLGILLLLALFGLNLSWGTPSGEPIRFPALGMLLQLAMVAAPGLMVVLAAALLTHGLQARAGRMPLLSIAVAVALVGYLAYSIFWASVWDQTSDGLGGVFLSQPSALVAVGAGMAMAIALSGWRRSVGLAFAMVVPILLYQALEAGWDISYHELTQARAERIAQALADYHEREGVYPPTLAALVPRYLLRVPQPVELQGETWCYQGGADFYRLGAFYREFFSLPVALQVYAAEGRPDSDWACAEQLAAMKERYGSPMADPGAMQPPPPTPLPPSDVAREAEALEPLPGEGEMLWGSWSPDGAYFLLGQRKQGNIVTLSFLDGRSGERCEAGGNYDFPSFTVTLREHHAWLPGGQLLLVDDTEKVVLLAPCTPELEDVTPEAAQGITQIMAAEAGRVLFKGNGEYWMLDGSRLTWHLVPDVTPNPYDAHWDHASWQPGGERLAISRLNGRDASEGSTLYIVDGNSAEVVRVLPLPAAYDQSAARVDWLASQELLMMGGGMLRRLDLSTDPPATTEVMAEIFGLDLDFPDEISGHGWWVDWEGGNYWLTVRANHPRNQAYHVYQSVTGTVEVYDEESLLALFADGQLEQWTAPEVEPPAEDQFVLVNVTTGAVSPPLTIRGHTPRNYPRLHIVYLEETEQLAVASSQGISLHTLPDGEMTRFWRLTGQGFAPHLHPAPEGSALVAVQDQGGVYWLPLSQSIH